MASTSTSGLGLNKPTPGTSEPFSTAVVNTNWDLVDAAVLADRVRLTAIEAANWVTSARILDGAVTNAKIASGVDGGKVTSGTVYDSTRWAGRKVFVQSSFPTSGMVSGDVLFKI
jgi:hypothetical protein